MSQSYRVTVRRLIITLLFLLVALLLSACGLPAYTTQSIETQGVNTPTGPLNVSITSFNGPITITPGADGRVEAVLERRSQNPDQTAAEAETDAISMSISQQGPDVTIVVKFAGEQQNFAQAALDVTIPPGSDLQVVTGSGAIEARGPFGDVTAEIGSGGITFGATEDESFALSVTAGAGELQSDFEAISSRPLNGTYEATVGESPARQLTAILGSGKVFLRQISDTPSR